LNLPAPPRPDAHDSRAVSVVIPAFNYAHFLPQAIASVLGQTHSALELLVVDDGSTDNTPAVVASFADPRLRYIWQENAGLSASRNTGIREARHPFVAFLDADDIWKPELLACVLDRFAGLPEDFACVATGTTRMDASGQPSPTSHYNASHTRELTVRDFCLRNHPLSSSVVVKRHVFAETGGFDTALRSSEDRDMWIRLTARGHRFFLIGEPCAFIRRHPTNMSKNAPRMKRNTQRVLARAWQRGAVSRLAAPFWLRTFSIHYFLVAWTHFDDGLRIAALRYWLTSVALWPLFLRPSLVIEPPLFRLRALAHFLLPRRP
jgi:cellulose synthase/poly-beta-1,6-N-acetylglucosamine synthase-like glycosyltransferase